MNAAIKIIEKKIRKLENKRLGLFKKPGNEKLIKIKKEILELNRALVLLLENNKKTK